MTLLDAIEHGRFDAAFGGARRDEERARAKERIFSFRDDFGQWDPRAQRPELWNLYNEQDTSTASRCTCSGFSKLDQSWTSGTTSSRSSSSCRRSTSRTSATCSSTTACCYAVSEYVEPSSDPFVESVRYRTVGDMTITGAVALAGPADVATVIAEISRRG